MSNFGELPFGEIPEPLKYVRPFQITTLSNGIRVCTEKTSGPLAQIGVYALAGSRNEDLETSGTSYLLEKMFLRGTNTRSKSQLIQDIGSIGGNYNANTDREISNFGLKVFKEDVAKGVKILGDMISNSTFN